VSSKKQQKANRRKARLSTGPRTAAGKAKVRLNALRHGLTGAMIVLPDEGPADFDAYRAVLIRELNPTTAVRQVLADKFVVDAWRMRRAPIHEANLFHCAYRDSLVYDAKLAKILDSEDRVRARKKKKLVAEKPRRTPSRCLLAPRPSSSLLGFC